MKDTFPKVTKAFKQKICNVPVSAVRGALKGLLMPEEIDACVTRVTQLQEYLQNVTEIDSFDEIDRNDYYNQVESGGMVAMNYASQIKKKTNDLEKKDHFASKFYDFHNYYTKNQKNNREDFLPDYFYFPIVIFTYSVLSPTLNAIRYSPSGAVSLSFILHAPTTISIPSLSTSSYPTKSVESGTSA